jgi:hypothetical protein
MPSTGGRSGVVFCYRSVSCTSDILRLLAEVCGDQAKLPHPAPLAGPHSPLAGSIASNQEALTEPS